MFAEAQNCQQMRGPRWTAYSEEVILPVEEPRLASENHLAAAVLWIVGNLHPHSIGHMQWIICNPCILKLNQNDNFWLIRMFSALAVLFANAHVQCSSTFIVPTENLPSLSLLAYAWCLRIDYVLPCVVQAVSMCRKRLFAWS